MKNKSKILTNCLGVISLLTFTSSALAVPVAVSYTISGSSGNYDLNFTVQNNMLAGSDWDVYFFGVELSARNITGSPAGWNPDSWPNWDNSGEGGSSINYNNNWVDNSHSSLPPGTSQSGFTVHITDATAPSTVNWFAFSYGFGAEYTGGDNFNVADFFGAINPGFEGIAATGAVPDASSTLSLLSVVVIALGGMSRRFRKIQTSVRS